MHQVVQIREEDDQDYHGIEQIRPHRTDKVPQIPHRRNIPVNRPHNPLQPIKLHPQLIPAHLLKLHIPFKPIILPVTAVVRFIRPGLIIL